MDERARGREQWYPTQAKTGLEWGTPTSVAGAEGRVIAPLTCSRQVGSLMTKLRAVAHLGMSGGGWTEPKKTNLDTSDSQSSPSTGSEQALRD